MNENQTTYPTGAQDAEEIDLVALMVTLLHKLKPILLTAVVCAVIAGRPCRGKDPVRRRCFGRRSGCL